MNIDKTIKSAHFQAYLNGWIPNNEKINVYSANNLQTAYWQFQPPHKIVVGEDIDKNIRSKSLISDYYTDSYFYHELAHAKYTERNHKLIQEELKKENIPFKLFNLFEDARIEDKWRKETGRPFNWAEYENLPLIKCYKSNEAALFYMIQFEGVDNLEKELLKSPIPDTTTITLVGYDRYKYKIIFSSSVHSIEVPFTNHSVDISKQFDLMEDISPHFSKYSYMACNSIKHPFYSFSSTHKNVTLKRKAKICHCAATLERVDGKLYSFNTFSDSSEHSHEFELMKGSANIDDISKYYQRILAAQTSMELIPICKDWLKDNPNVLDNLKQIQFFRDTNEETVDNIETGTMHIKTKAVVVCNQQKYSKNEQAPTPYEDGLQSNLSNGDPLKFFKNTEDVLDKTKINSLAKKFEHIIKRNAGRISTEIPQKRLNIRGYAMGSDKIYKKKEAGHTLAMKKSIAIIMDCSGSMSGKPMQEGKILLATLNKLAKEDVIDCSIILSATDDNKHICATYKLPIKNDIIFSKLKTLSCEGFAQTIEQTEPLLMQADYVFVYTDGCIGDKPDLDYAHKRGIYTYGLYAGDTDMTNTLLDFFDCAISRTFIEETINALIRKIK